MNKLSFLPTALIAILAVFAVSCTTTKEYSGVRYRDRQPYDHYDRYGYYNSYPAIIESYPYRSGRYYSRDNREYRNNNNRYYQQRSGNNDGYRRNNDYREQRQKQYDHQRKETRERIEKSKNKIFGNEN